MILIVHRASNNRAGRAMDNEQSSHFRQLGGVGDIVDQALYSHNQYYKVTDLSTALAFR